MPSNTKGVFGDWGYKGGGGTKSPGGGGGSKSPGGGGGSKSPGGDGGTKSPGDHKVSGGNIKAGYHPLFIRSDIRRKLQELGMSEAGINALVCGAMITDKNDKSIVAQIVAAALQ